MILEILRFGRRLDKKLEAAVGRPYRVVISVGLIAEIAAQVRELTHAQFTRAHLIQTLIWIAIGVLLVINQLGELSNRMEQRTRRGVASNPGAGDDADETSPVGAGRGRGRRM